MIGRKSFLFIALATSVAASPAFALTPEQDAAAEQAYSLIERATECGDTVRKQGMNDYALDLANEMLIAAGLSTEEAATLSFEMTERARAELTLETIARFESECLAAGPKPLVDWLNEPWIPATAPNYGWWHGDMATGGHSGVFRFEDDTAFDYQCTNDDTINVGTAEDQMATAARVLSIYVWDDHSGLGSLSVDGIMAVNVDFTYSDDMEDSFGQYHVRTDAPQAEQDRFNAFIDAIANGTMMRITVGSGNIIEIPLDDAGPIAMCNG